MARRTEHRGAKGIVLCATLTKGTLECRVGGGEVLRDLLESWQGVARVKEDGQVRTALLFNICRI